jgi:plasmid stabilization system protein ParE
MDLKVKWSPEAVEDIESIAEYIARDSQFYARATVSKIVDFSRSVGKFPQAGRIVPEFKDKYIRERLVYSYRLVYRIERMSILIIAIIHDKRLFNSITERFV